MFPSPKTPDPFFLFQPNPRPKPPAIFFQLFSEARLFGLLPVLPGSMDSLVGGVVGGVMGVPKEGVLEPESSTMLSPLPEAHEF